MPEVRGSVISQATKQRVMNTIQDKAAVQKQTPNAALYIERLDATYDGIR